MNATTARRHFKACLDLARDRSASPAARYDAVQAGRAVAYTGLPGGNFGEKTERAYIDLDLATDDLRTDDYLPMPADAELPSVGMYDATPDQLAAALAHAKQLASRTRTTDTTTTTEDTTMTENTATETTETTETPVPAVATRQRTNRRKEAGPKAAPKKAAPKAAPKATPTPAPTESAEARVQKVADATGLSGLTVETRQGGKRHVLVITDADGARILAYCDPLQRAEGFRLHVQSYGSETRLTVATVKAAAEAVKASPRVTPKAKAAPKAPKAAPKKAAPKARATKAAKAAKAAPAPAETETAA
jgi:hypothetical protein